MTRPKGERVRPGGVHRLQWGLHLTAASPKFLWAPSGRTCFSLPDRRVAAGLRETPGFAAVLRPGQQWQLERASSTKGRRDALSHEDEYARPKVFSIVTFLANQIGDTSITIQRLKVSVTHLMGNHP